MTMHDLAAALAERLEEEGITDEELERIIHDAKEEARQEIARIKGADDNRDYERAVEQMEYDMLYEPTYNPEDGSM